MHPGSLESHVDHGLDVALVGLRLVLLGALLAAPFTPVTTLEGLMRILDPARSWWWGPLTRADCGRTVMARLLLYHLDGSAVRWAAGPCGATAGKAPR